MEFKLPELGEGVYEAEAVRWLVKDGDAVKPGQPLLEVLTDKATMEVPAPFTGVLSKLLVKPGQKIEIGDVILEYDTKSAPKVEKKTKANEEPVEPTIELKGKAPVAREKPAVLPLRDGATIAVKAAPSVRMLARKLGVDLSHIHGSGPAGRILIDDLARAIPSSGLTAKPAAPAMDLGTPGTRLPFAGLRRKIAEHMVQAKTEIPHYTYVDECDVSEMVRLREALKESFTARGTKLTYLAFVVKAVVAALKEAPIVNATLDEKAGEIVLHDTYHIGIAVATPGGLIVPVVKHADKKSLLEIAAEIERLSSDARLGKQHLDDLKGGTFSVTSIGNIGGLFATPIIPPGQLGILGVGKIAKRPVFDEHGSIKPADMVYLSFSFDHRVLDGAVGAAFGNAVIRHLQNPAAMLL